MEMNRRDAMKMGALSVAAVATATTMTACKEDVKPGTSGAMGINKSLGKHKVVVIGGGFGGLTVANNLMKKNKDLDLLVIEKNDTFMSCPGSNMYLGKLENVELGTFVFDYAQPVEKYGYKILHAEVIGVDRVAKQVQTVHGTVGYDILVLSPGIGYDYEGQFPEWSQEKIAEVKRVAPGALIPGSEHIALERQLENMEDGDVYITVPAGKFRCPPAPFERASMIAAYMKKEDIAGKVILLNPSNKIAKGAAFKESWKELYGDMIEHIDYATIIDVDPKAKTVTYKQKIIDPDGFEKTVVKQKTANFEVLNLIPTNKANPVIEMAGLQTSDDAFHKVLMNGCTFQSLTDKNIYVVGDVVGHAIPLSGQTAVWAGKQCAAEITARLQGKSYDLPVKTKTVQAGNVCYSMVGDNPEEGIKVIHDFSWTGKTIKGKGHVPKDANSGKFRSKGTAKALRDWYSGITADLFS